MSLRVGIDVGGTNTDAVVLRDREVIAETKRPTSDDVTGGIRAALADVLVDVDVREIDSVFIGTTHFVNAIAQARGLRLVAAIRLATPPQSLLPTLDWPDHLLPVIGDHFYVCPGGAQFDGRPLSDVDEAELRSITRTIRDAGIRHIALSSVFSVVNPVPEELAESIILDEHPEAVVTRSTQVGRVGLLERENATILNAALLDLAGSVITAFETIVAESGIDAPILLSQNDGTVMTLDRARRFPIFTVSSGPTNSMRGAALLTGIQDAVVVDVGGTTSDIGLLQSGFPRESTVAMSIAGVRSNFRIPDVLSLALGGGTIVSADGTVVGPESVGYRISTEAKVFGGDTLTITDIAVAAGAPEVGDKSRVGDIPEATVTSALELIADRISHVVEKAKLTSSDIPVLIVGGGGPLLRAVEGLDGAIIPDHAGVINAIGAAFAEAGGEVDRIFDLTGTTRADALAAAKDEAITNAVAAGADPDTVRIVDADDIPLTHLGGGSAIRIRVKAVGPFGAHAHARADEDGVTPDDAATQEELVSAAAASATSEGF